MLYFVNAKATLEARGTRPTMARKMTPRNAWEQQDRHIDGARWAEACDDASLWAQRKEFASAQKNRAAEDHARLCQTCFSLARPGDYFPESPSDGVCCGCGDDTFVARVSRGEIEDLFETE